MKTVIRMTITLLLSFAIGAFFYFLVLINTPSDNRKMIMEIVKSDTINFSKKDVKRFQDLTDNKMSEQELKDTYIILIIKKHPSLNQKYQNDVHFCARYDNLIEKYNIFTLNFK